jgi:hypothetical protein
MNTFVGTPATLQPQCEAVDLASSSNGSKLGLPSEWNAMWTIEAVRHHVDLGINKEGRQVGFWETRYVARNEEGVTIFRAGGGRGHDEIFRYQGSRISSDFSASRYDGHERLTDTYHVPIILPEATTLADARVFARNIRDALLALPPEPIVHEGRPPRTVTFDWRLWNKTHPDSRVEGDQP